MTPHQHATPSRSAIERALGHRLRHKRSTVGREGMASAPPSAPATLSSPEAIRATSAHYATILVHRFVPGTPEPRKALMYMLCINKAEHTDLVQLADTVRHLEPQSGRRFLQTHSHQLYAMLTHATVENDHYGFHTMVTSGEIKDRLLRLLIELARDLNAVNPGEVPREPPASDAAPSTANPSNTSSENTDPVRPVPIAPQKPVQSGPPQLNSANATIYASASPIAEPSLEVRARERREEAQRRAKEAAANQAIRDENMRKTQREEKERKAAKRQEELQKLAAKISAARRAANPLKVRSGCRRA